MTIKQRIAVGALSLSAIGLVKLISDESFTPKAIIPTKGDRPTVGFGSTYRDDGTPVQMGDTITVPQALKRTLEHIDKDETRLRLCVTAPVTQIEWDTLVNHEYQYGSTATCKSSMVRLVNAGDYAGACQAYLQYRFAAGYDCSTLVNGKPNKRCYGVYQRSKDRRDQCMAAQ